tara:strand:+ start:561 stop:812 length:252 start_codon:yes stop_codon:yes gene_type:complete
MNRHELKQLWFNLDNSNVKERKEIIVDLRYVKNKFWPGYGYVQILSDGPDGYSSFSTHQEHPLEYAKDRMKEEKYKEYKLVIK